MAGSPARVLGDALSRLLPSGWSVRQFPTPWPNWVEYTVEAHDDGSAEVVTGSGEKGFQQARDQCAAEFARRRLSQWAEDAGIFVDDVWTDFPSLVWWDFNDGRLIAVIVCERDSLWVADNVTHYLGYEHPEARIRLVAIEPIAVANAPSLESLIKDFGTDSVLLDTAAWEAEYEAKLAVEDRRNAIETAIAGGARRSVAEWLVSQEGSEMSLLNDLGEFPGDWSEDKWRLFADKQRAEAYAELDMSTPERWKVGRATFDNDAGLWELRAIGNGVQASAGEVARTAQTEVECVLKMAWCLREIAAGRVPR